MSISPNKARDHLLAGELEEFADNVVLANQISMHGNYRSYLLAVNVPLTLLEEAGDQLEKDKKKEIFDQGLAYLRHVRGINPRSSSALYYLAKIQQLAPKEFIPEDLETPETYYAKALAFDPLHIGSRMELSQIYERSGDQKKAIELLEQGLGYKYSTSKVMDYYSRLLKIYLKNGNQEGREDVLTKMKAFQNRLKNSEHKKSKSLSAHLWGS